MKKDDVVRHTASGQRGVVTSVYTNIRSIRNCNVQPFNEMNIVSGTQSDFEVQTGIYAVKPGDMIKLNCGELYVFAVFSEHVVLSYSNKIESVSTNYSFYELAYGKAEIISKK